jgi:hypothetical protein
MNFCCLLSKEAESKVHFMLYIGFSYKNGFMEMMQLLSFLPQSSAEFHTDHGVAAKRV